MGIAITTKFRGPTNTRGSRYSASAGGKPDGGSDRLSREADNRLNPTKNRAAVAQALAQKLEWTGVWMAGGLDGNDIVYVRAPVSDEKAAMIALCLDPAFEGEDWFMVEKVKP